MLEADNSLRAFLAIVMVLAINKHLIQGLSQAGFVTVELGSQCSTTS